MDRKQIMKQWGYWRSEIANGHKGSAPRDWFESILDHYEETIEEFVKWLPLRNDFDAYLHELARYTLGETKKEPDPKDYGITA
jgi:hypothetical protein